jgi:hypothetical protein
LKAGGNSNEVDLTALVFFLRTQWRVPFLSANSKAI